MFDLLWYLLVLPIYLNLFQGNAFRKEVQRKKKCLHFSKLNITNILIWVKPELNTKSITEEEVFSTGRDLGQWHFCLLEEYHVVYSSSLLLFSINLIKVLLNREFLRILDKYHFVLAPFFFLCHDCIGINLS